MLNPIPNWTTGGRGSFLMPSDKRGCFLHLKKSSFFLIQGPPYRALCSLEALARSPNRFISRLAPPVNVQCGLSVCRCCADGEE